MAGVGRSDTAEIEPTRPVVDEVPLFGSGRARRRRIARRILTATGAALTLVLLAGSVFVLTQRNVSTEVTLDAAVEQFRRKAVADPSEPVESEVAPTTVAEPVGTGPDRAPAEAPAAQEARPAEAVAGGPVAAAPFVLPAEGVYSYRTTGREELSTFGASHTYPERTFATVHHLGGCRWEQRNEVLEEHVDIRRFCGSDGLLEQLYYEAQVTFFGQTDGAAVECTPPSVFHRAGMKAGHAAEFECSDGEGTTTRMTITYVGDEAVTIDGVQVRSHKITLDGKTSGRVEGTSFDELWLHPTNGLTLRWERQNDNLATAYGARVRYKEQATFILESLEPQR